MPTNCLLAFFFVEVGLSYGSAVSRPALPRAVRARASPPKAAPPFPLDQRPRTRKPREGWLSNVPTVPTSDVLFERAHLLLIRLQSNVAILHELLHTIILYDHLHANASTLDTPAPPMLVVVRICEVGEPAPVPGLEPLAL